MKRGFTCGTFDLFHTGHSLFLKTCKEYCDELVVGIQVDPSVERKDKNKPVQTILERYLEVKSCRFVDEIVVYETEEDLTVILKNFKLDVRFLGSDYLDKKSSITGKDLLPIEYIHRNNNYSSSLLRERVKKAK